MVGTPRCGTLPGVLDLASVPESRLGADDRARIPPRSAPAPWSTRLRAVVWVHRASPSAVALLPEALRSRRTLPLTVGAFVQYLDTPVGPYSEVFGSPVVVLRAGLPAIHVPFMAVDLPASVHGGRANWALPKTLASFSGARTSLRADGDGWTVGADATEHGPRLPLAAVARDVQVDEAGRELVIPVTARGLWRAARVEVRTSGPTLPSWLVGGTHRGLVLHRARMTFGEPR